MSTAHRPTYAPAKAVNTQGGYKRWTPTAAVSAKDLPGQLKVKLRQPGQNAPEEVAKRDLRKELEERERKHFEKKKLAIQNKTEDEEKLQEEELKKIEPAEKSVEKIEKDKKEEEESESDTDDSDDELEETDDDSDDELEETDDDSDDDAEEAELLRELERIKKEREAELLRKQEEEILTGNPLLQPVGTSNATLKRKWDDDVVFKNQARDEPKIPKRFINDTIRSDFHRKFLKKYIH